MPDRLHFGDNLEVLRAHVRDESVDLIYLDPPFNSNADYNILFAPPKSLRTRADGGHAQIRAFEDSWHWNDAAADAFDQVERGGNVRCFDLLRAMRDFLGENDMMAYLAMMAVRLVELHRVLKPTGSLYLHCDPTASHYLKLLLDSVFGAKAYRSEIIWRRTTARESRRRWPRLHDVILHYARDPAAATFHPPRMAIDSEWLDREYRHIDDRGRYVLSDLTGAGTRNGPSGAVWRGIDPAAIGSGRHWRQVPAKLDELDAHGSIHWPERGRYPKLKRYLTEASGTSVGDLWTDIHSLGRTAGERLGYPTQKPVALLERIIAASSNPGDVVLDPFCGCGTAVHAAQKLGRRWIGIDVTHLAISLIERRLRDAFPDADFKVEGSPGDLASALDLARRDKHQFELWAVAAIGGVPHREGRKGADGGIDGVLYFRPDGRKAERAVVSVKGGANVGVGMIRDLHSAMMRTNAPIGIFVTAAEPTAAMLREAAATGRYRAEVTGRAHPRLQILTIAQLFEGRRPDVPMVDVNAVLRRAPREEAGRQASLL